MNKELQALLSLVRAGLWGRYDEAMASVFPLSSESWERVFIMARQQTVTGLAFRGLDYLPEEATPSLGLTAKWMAYADRIEQGNHVVNSALARLTSHFKITGRKVVLQKGPGVAVMYLEPTLREYGDLDLYFPECADASDPMDGISGVRKEAKPDGSWEYEVDGVIVERHTHLVDVQSPRAKKFVRGLILEKGYDVINVNGSEVFVPAPEVNLLLLSSHILKHALGVGIGLRQFCDMAVAMKFYSDRVDSQEMREIYRKVGLGKWAELLEVFLIKYLGSEAGLLFCCQKEECNEKKSRILLDIILKGGNFGRFTNKRELTSRNKMLRKMHTLTSFWGNLSFALTYAPGEWFWTMIQLAGGQLR